MEIEVICNGNFDGLFGVKEDIILLVFIYECWWRGVLSVLIKNIV